MNGNSSFVAEFEGLWRRPLADYRHAIQTYTIAIDTNVLLDLYRFTPKARHELLDLLRKVQERLWVPHQVAKEYFARRIDALKDQLDLYESVPRELKTLHDRAITQVNTFARRCSLSDKDKEALSDPLRKALASVTSEIERHRNSLDLTLAKVASNDPILEALADILDGRTGQSLSLFHHRSELVRCRVRTAWTRGVIRVVAQRSLRRSRQFLRVAMACSTSARIFAWDRFTAF